MLLRIFSMTVLILLTTSTWTLVFPNSAPLFCILPGKTAHFCILLHSSPLYSASYLYLNLYLMVKKYLFFSCAKSRKMLILLVFTATVLILFTRATWTLVLVNSTPLFCILPGKTAHFCILLHSAPLDFASYLYLNLYLKYMSII